MGVLKAFELFYDATVLNSATALELGLVNRVVLDDEFMSEVMAYARQIAAGPPMGYTGIRRLIQESVNSVDREVFLDREWGMQTALLRSGDAGEGFKSFLERREPQFTGS